MRDNLLQLRKNNQSGYGKQSEDRAGNCYFTLSINENEQHNSNQTIQKTHNDQT
nr:MAG TPA: hypothetical protein [Bacteriophage sp.]